jgi:hypothetical protein
MKLDPGMHIGMHLVSFGKSGVTYTRQFLWLGSSQVNLSNDGVVEVPLLHLRLEIEGLLIFGVEPEPWRQLKDFVDAHPMWLLLMVSHASLASYDQNH